MKKPIESLWGTIVTCSQIAPEIYMVEAETQDDESGFKRRNGGIMLPMRIANALLSSKAIPFGECCDVQDSDGDTIEFIHFERDVKMIIPLYELIESEAITDYAIIREFTAQQLLEDGKLLCPEYFGEFELTPIIQLGSKFVRKLCNGIWAVDFMGETRIVVHRVLADFVLSSAAVKFGAPVGDCLDFPGATSAIPLYELRFIYPSIADLIQDDEESLFETLKKRFPVYSIVRGIDFIHK